MTQSFYELTLGRKVRIIDSSDGLVAIPFYAIACPFSPVTVTSMALDADSSGASKLANQSMDKGSQMVIPGTSIQLTSGTAVLYLL